MKDRVVLQIVMEEAMLKTLMAQWEASPEPASLSTSCQLAAESFRRLRDLAGFTGMIFRWMLSPSMTEGI